MPLQSRLAVPALATLNVPISSITRPVRLAVLPHITHHVLVIREQKLSGWAPRSRQARL